MKKPKRWSKTGKREELLLLLLSNAVYDTDTGCIEWLGPYDRDGYGHGRLHPKAKLQRIHRLAYSLVVGSIPKGKVIMHMCDNRKCFNPAHLLLGTQSENIQDMWDKGRR